MYIRYRGTDRRTDRHTDDNHARARPLLKHRCDKRS